jgi:hypothetical protein
LDNYGELSRVSIANSRVAGNETLGSNLLSNGSWATSLVVRNSTFVDNSTQQGIFSSNWRSVQVEDSSFHRNDLPGVPPTQDSGAVMSDSGPYRLRNVDFGVGSDTNHPRDIDGCADYGVIAQFQAPGGGCPP